MIDYYEIEARIAEARRARSEAVGGYLVAGWNWCIGKLTQVVRHRKADHKSGNTGHTPYLPA